MRREVISLLSTLRVYLCSYSSRNDYPHMLNMSEAEADFKEPLQTLSPQSGSGSAGAGRFPSFDPPTSHLQSLMEANHDVILSFYSRAK